MSHELAVINEQFPYEPLKFLEKTLRLTFAEGIQMLQEAGYDVSCRCFMVVRAWGPAWAWHARTMECGCVVDAGGPGRPRQPLLAAADVRLTSTRTLRRARRWTPLVTSTPSWSAPWARL